MRTIPVLAAAALSLALPSVARALCGGDTRTVVDSLTCEDIATDARYRINVNVMCGTLSGVETTLIEVEEQRLRADGSPSLTQQGAKIWKSKQAHEVYKAGKKEWKLWSQRAGKAGQLEAHAVPAEDGKTVSAVRLKITPNGGDVCEKTVDITRAWETDFKAAASR